MNQNKKQQQKNIKQTNPLKKQLKNNETTSEPLSAATNARAPLQNVPS